MLQAYDKEGRKLPFALEETDYVIDDGEPVEQTPRSVNVDQRVMPESNGLLIEVPKIFYDSLTDCCNKLLDAYECADYRKVNKYKNGLRILLNR